MPKLYMFPGSPPSRSIQICAKALGLELEEHYVNIHKREQFKPEFVKINFQHSLPTLIDDDGFTLWDSHAILSYIVEKYGKNDALYPKDLKKRAIVNQRLHFDSNVFFPRGKIIVTNIVYYGATGVQEDHKIRMYEAYDFIEKFFESGEWIAGDSFTIADICFLTGISSFSTIVLLDDSKHSKIKAWLERAQKMPCCEIDIPGLERFKEIVTYKIKN